MNIEPKYVTFEQAKLLKEKGWDINTYSNCWVKTLDGEIIHNSYGQAMIDFSTLVSGETVFRQEVNPIEHRGSDEWVVDK